MLSLPVTPQKRKELDANALSRWLSQAVLRAGWDVYSTHYHQMLSEGEGRVCDK